MLTRDITFPYAGYHKIDLGRTLGQAKGNRYSIVAKAVRNGKSTVYFNHAETLEGFINYYPSRQARHADSGKDPNTFKPDMLYSKGVVNKGESFIGVGSADGTQWADWADVTADLKSLNAAQGMDLFTYDYFPIRSYPETEPITATNIVTEERESYTVGEEVKGLTVIGNNTDTDFGDDVTYELTVTIGASQTKITTSAAGLKAGENRTFAYSYTVTGADVMAGKIDSIMTVKRNGEAIAYDPVFGDILRFTVTASGAYLLGDADGDGAVTILDATAIQRHLADLPTAFCAAAADVDGEDGVTIIDANYLQRWLAGLPSNDEIGQVIR